MVGVSKRVRTGSSMPRVERMRLTRRVASREWPPSSKKLSSMLTAGRPRMSANSPHRISSCGVRGVRPAPVAGQGRVRAGPAVELAVGGQREARRARRRREGTM